MLAGLLEPLRRLVVTEQLRGRIQYFKRDPGFQVVLGLRERFQLIIGRLHGGIAIDLTFLAIRLRPNLLKEAGPMKVEVGREVLMIESIDEEWSLINASPLPI